MTPPKVKICGLTRVADAEAAAKLGADAIGLNFWPGSKRFVRTAVARRIVRDLPPFLTVVGVFVNATRDEIRRTAEACRLDLVQLHGDESPAFCARLGLHAIKALRISDATSLAQAERYPGTLLLDAPGGAAYGGTGRTFDWRLVKGLDRRVILAGGLNPENVARAVRAAHPYAVDVASGVESAPGIKDPKQMARFIRAARAVQKL